jgi:hypothetical protein
VSLLARPTLSDISLAFRANEGTTENFLPGCEPEKDPRANPSASVSELKSEGIEGNIEPLRLGPLYAELFRRCTSDRGSSGATNAGVFFLRPNTMIPGVLSRGEIKSVS